MSRHRLVVSLCAFGLLFATVTAATQAGAPAEEIRKELLRLPYYGVFDYIVFRVDRGTVYLAGYSFQGNLKGDAEKAVKRAAGVDEVANKIEVLPASQNDDRIRWATFYKIYTDDFLSRYAPGGATSARYELLTFSRFPSMQPFGNYPIHIIVKHGRTMLVGVVDNEADKTLAGVRAREVPRTFEVSNELVVDRR